MMVQLVNIFYLLAMLAADFAIVVVWNIIAGFIYRAIFSPRQMLLIHGDRPFDDIIQNSILVKTAMMCVRLSVIERDMKDFMMKSYSATMQ
jgi:hypothetical protein